MRIARLIGILVLAVVGWGAGYVYFGHYQLEQADSRVDMAHGKTGEARLVFPVTETQWSPPSAGEVEVGTQGWYDFWFENQDTVPVDIGFLSATCGCVDVSYCLLGAEEARRYRAWSLVTSVAEISAAQRGPLGLIPELVVHNRWAATSLDWKRVDWTSGQEAVVAPGDGGFVRAHWHDKNRRLGTLRLGVDLSAKPEAPGLKTYPRLELTFTVVPPVRVSAGQLNVGELAPQEQRSAEFLCWSSTRAELALEVRERSGDPGISVVALPATNAERERLARSSGTRVLAAYRVKVAVAGREKSARPVQAGSFVRDVVVGLRDEDDAEVTLELRGARR